MPLEISFTLSDDDLARFQDIVDKGRVAVESDDTAREIEDAARALLEATKQASLPGFIAERMQKLQVVLDMIDDEEWGLNQEERRHVLSALAYLCDPQDVIPDHVPGLGFLDDAIYAEIVLRALANEVAYYQEFCTFREAEESRRKAAGDDTAVDREAWLQDKREALQSTMRKHRLSAGGWRMRLADFLT